MFNDISEWIWLVSLYSSGLWCFFFFFSFFCFLWLITSYGGGLKKSKPKHYLKFVMELLKTCSLFSKRRKNAEEIAFERARRRFMNAVTEGIRFNGVWEEHVGCLDGGWLIGCGHPWGQHTKREEDAGQFVAEVPEIKHSNCSRFCFLCWAQTWTTSRSLCEHSHSTFSFREVFSIIPQDLHKWKQSRDVSSWELILPFSETSLLTLLPSFWQRRDFNN